jgi:hypothetical protein
MSGCCRELSLRHDAAIRGARAGRLPPVRNPGRLPQEAGAAPLGHLWGLGPILAAICRSASPVRPRLALRLAPAWARGRPVHLVIAVGTRSAGQPGARDRDLLTSSVLRLPETAMGARARRCGSGVRVAGACVFGDPRAAQFDERTPTITPPRARPAGRRTSARARSDSADSAFAHNGDERGGFVGMALRIARFSTAFQADDEGSIPFTRSNLLDCPARTHG